MVARIGIKANQKTPDHVVDSNTKMKPKEAKLKFTYNEQKEYAEIDAVIAALETSIEKIDLQIGESTSNYSKLSELMSKKEEIEKELEEKMDRWVYLNDLAEQIENAKK
jgi:ATP-binding cassette subfamily F protein uup